MKSTGEVMGIDTDFDIAFAKSLLGAGMILPQQGTAFVSVKDADKDNIVPAVEKLVELGFSIIATGGTATHLQSKGLPVEVVNKVAQGRPHIVDKLLDGDVALVFNTTEGWQSLKDSHSIRATALKRRCPISRPPPRAWPRRGRSRRSGGTRLKSRRCNPIIPLLKRASIDNLQLTRALCGALRGRVLKRVLRHGECRKGADAGGRPSQAHR